MKGKEPRTRNQDDKTADKVKRNPRYMEVPDIRSIPCGIRIHYGRFPNTLMFQYNKLSTLISFLQIEFILGKL